MTGLCVKYYDSKSDCSKKPILIVEVLRPASTTQEPDGQALMVLLGDFLAKLADHQAWVYREETKFIS